MKLVLCLGNIGTQYDNTYHNVGFAAADFVANKFECTFSKKAKNSVYFKKENFIIAKPTTYMNLSGKAATELMQKFKIAPENCLVVFDDFDLPSGTIKKRLSGSGGTHNGARDLVLAIGTNFKRLKIGIKPPEMKCDLKTFVTAKISSEEQQKINNAIELAAGEIEKFVKS